MKILITGSDGMLGKALRRELKDDELWGIGRKAAAFEDHRYRPCDITERAAVFKVLREIRPEIVIHAAAFTHVDGCEEEPDKALTVNFEGTRNVVDAFEELGPENGSNAFLIFISTDYLFDGAKAQPYGEDDPPHPLNFYGKSKLLAENYIRRRGTNCLILRTSWLFGPGGKNFVETILRLAREKNVLEVVDDQTGRPTYTRDLAAAIRDLIALRRGPLPAEWPKVLHAANRGATTWYEFARTIVSMAGERCGVSPVSSVIAARPAQRPFYSVLDTAKTEKMMGRNFRPWQEALGDYLEILGRGPAAQREEAKS